MVSALNKLRWAYLFCALAILLSGCGPSLKDIEIVPPNVANTPNLKTWWHSNASPYEIGEISSNKIRQSFRYHVKIASATAPDTRYDAFTYLSIPRNGRGKQGYSEADGAEYAAESGLNMSWTSFLYHSDAIVDVTFDGPAITSANDVTLRPLNLNLQKERLDDNTIRIHVPYSSDGLRFSVEFTSNLQTDYQSPQGQLTTSATGNTEVHTAPKNALLIFAEPMPAANDPLVPDANAGSIYYPQEGVVDNLDPVTADVIYFRPGTYSMPWNYRASLSSSVKWIYLAPGAYVKGAFYVPPGQPEFKITGFGVLSGEDYVYEADMNNGFQHRAANTSDCHGSCVKLLQFGAGSSDQHLTLHGITLNAPPYNTFVAYGDIDHFRVDASHYKQVGAWYWQTDGLELYPGSSLSHAFFHSNDDVIKLYHSNVSVNDVVVWKGENGPVVQWGWTPRTINNVQLDGLDVIHNVMHWPGTHNSCILNSARSYLDTNSTQTANPSSVVSNLLLQNIRVEGKSMCAIRFNALSSWQNIHIKNLAIESWNGLDSNTFQALTDANNTSVTISNQTSNGQGLAIENFTVGNVLISKTGNNWQSNQAGRLNFDGGLWEGWDAW